MIDRRQFLELASALAALQPASLSATPSSSAAFSGRLSRMIFLDDVLCLAAQSPAIPKAAARAIAAQREWFLAASKAPAPPAGSNEKPVGEVLAAARLVQPALAAIDPGDGPKRIGRDARLLREVTTRAGLQPSKMQPTAAASAFDALSRRMLIAIHTYIPDDKDVEGWMDRLIRLYDSSNAYWPQLASAFQSSRSMADSFYDASDPIIRAAAAVEFGSISRAEFGRALESKPKSAYGNALLDAHSRLTAS